MKKFEPGAVLHKQNGAKVVVKALLSDTGATACLYTVSDGGKEKALKWFRPDFCSAEYKRRIARMIADGAPDAAFVWPQELIEDGAGGFGYLMELLPRRYHTLTVIQNDPSLRLKSFRAVCNAALTAARAFAVLSRNGKYFKDISPRNTMIDCDTGALRIIDTDNISSSTSNKGIDGTPTYIAPEVMAGAPPTKYSDLLAYATLVFEMFFNNHPLHGKRYFKCICLTPEIAVKLYQTDPLFIFDEHNNDNAPMAAQENVVAIWNAMPEHMRRLFRRAFSRTAYANPESRVQLEEWAEHLMALRSELAVCPCCGEENAVEKSVQRCDGCGTTLKFEHRIKLPHYSLPLHKNTTLLKGQVTTVKWSEMLRPFAAAVTDKKSHRFGIVNLSGTELTGEALNGKERAVRPLEVVPYIKGIKLKSGARTLIEFN